MRHKTGSPLPEPIAQLQRQFEQFRSSHAHRTRLPESLWQAAVVLARQHGLNLVAHPLRLDYTQLKKRLAVKSLDGGTTWQRIFTGRGVDDLWIQLADGAQPGGLPAIARVQRLAQDELSAGGIVAEIEPVGCAISGLR